MVDQVTLVIVPNAVIGISQSNLVYVSPGLAFCLNCTESVGFPESEISFKRNNRYIDFRDPQLFRDDSLLCFRGITASYNGSYSCTAVNNAGTDTESVQIAVGGKTTMALH